MRPPRAIRKPCSDPIPLEIQFPISCALVNALLSDGFGVNYDPSNAYIAGDDPIELLKRKTT